MEVSCHWGGGELARAAFDYGFEEYGVDFHVLLPAAGDVDSVLINGQRLKYNQTKVRQSSYVDFSARVIGKCLVNICLK